jgi:hypothetical protein
MRDLSQQAIRWRKTGSESGCAADRKDGVDRVGGAGTFHRDQSARYVHNFEGQCS